MRMIGYIDGQRRFVRDDVTPKDGNCIAAYLRELGEFMKVRVVLFIEHDDGITHMMQTWRG